MWLNKEKTLSNENCIPIDFRFLKYMKSCMKNYEKMFSK